MSHENLKNRTKLFALEVIRHVESLPPGQTCKILGNQLLRSGTSVGQIIVPPAEANPLLILSPKWERSRRKLMNQVIGWSC
jgi:hypothetical protein